MFSACLWMSSGLPGVDAHRPRLSFSAGLTDPKETAGTVVFNRVFVNEGNFYNPATGERAAGGSGPPPNPTGGSDPG